MTATDAEPPGAEIDIADHIHHGPSGEDWVVARVDGEHVYPAGWPVCRAALSDCTLIRKATATQRAQMLRERRNLPRGDSRHLADAQIEPQP